MTQPPVVLTIAGHDPSGGAGVTADLAVFAAHGLYGTSAVTVWTVQSTRVVAATRQMDAEFLARTLAVLAEDLPPAGVKIGALGGRECALATAAYLRTMVEATGAKPYIPRVFDPVLVSSSGRNLFAPEDVSVLLDAVLPAVDWITPNWAELGVLSGKQVGSLSQAGEAMAALGQRYAGLNVVATGGDQERPTDLVRLADGAMLQIEGERIASTSTHGTGCAFSSALLANLVLGKEPSEAVRAAKGYVAEGIRRAPGLGGGKGPLDLLWPLRDRQR